MRGIEKIAEERRQQIKKHGIAPENDVHFNSRFLSNNMFPLVAGAIGLLDPDFGHMPQHWNDNTVEHMRSKPYYEKLVIAGALIAAEIDRIDYIAYGAEPAMEETPLVLTTKQNKAALAFALWLGENSYNMISENLWVSEFDPIPNEYTTEELFIKYLNHVDVNE